MGHLSYGATAHGVTKDKLFEWFTDFSSEDVDIIKRRGKGGLLSVVATRDGNKIHVENVLRGIRGKPVKAIFDVVLHPEEYTYDVHVSVMGLAEGDQRFIFTQESEGTRVAYEGNYRTKGSLARFLAAIGILNRLVAKDGREGLNAYLAEAEAQLGQKQ